jgi:hypothetical protein
MALELVLTYWQTRAVKDIEMYQRCYADMCTRDEWAELTRAGYCYVDGFFYRAHETHTTPNFEMCEPDRNGSSSEAGDNAFEDSAASQRLIESGWMQR